MPTQLLDQTKEIILLIGRDGIIRYANKTALLKLSPDTPLIGNSFEKFISPINIDGTLNKILQAPDNTVMEQIVLMNSQGKDFYSDIRIFHRDDGQIALFITDLSHRMEFRRRILEKLQVIEALSKATSIKEGLMNETIEEVMRKSIVALDVSRVTLWLFDHQQELIYCIGSIIEDQGTFQLNTLKGEILYKKDFPKYYERMMQDDLVITDDVLKDPQTEELVDSYLIKYKITSMLDAPIRSNGQLIGVICFEHTGKVRKWNVYELKFALLIAQLVSLFLEGFEKNKLLTRQAELLQEKEQLMQEVKFRVRSSFSLVNALLNYQYNKLTHSASIQLIEEIKNHIFGVSSVHELLLEAVDFKNIRFEKYILRILGLMEKLYQGNSSINFQVQAPDVFLPISKALPCALIIFELLNYSYKESLINSPSGNVQIRLQKLGDYFQLVYTDNGKEVSEEMMNQKDALCIKLVEIFVQELNGTFELEAKNGNKFTIHFPIN
ncbi:MAG: GAF domain-containing protein [Flavobacteriales bacterium]|nr:GAF domain-containing protein [Flavobacteriales bacterium]